MQTSTNLGSDRLIWIFTQMVRIREFEERVKRTFVEGGAQYAEIAQRAINQDGELSVLASGTVRLPSRNE